MEPGPLALESLIDGYNELVQIQLDSVVCEFDGLSKNILNTVRVNHEAVFQDFACRKNTGAIPTDLANFYACLAGSMIMHGSAQSNNTDTHQIKAELVS